LNCSGDSFFTSWLSTLNKRNKYEENIFYIIQQSKYWQYRDPDLEDPHVFGLQNPDPNPSLSENSAFNTKYENNLIFKTEDNVLVAKL
jgi:hypothetical protein